MIREKAVIRDSCLVIRENLLVAAWCCSSWNRRTGGERKAVIRDPKIQPDGTAVASSPHALRLLALLDVLLKYTCARQAAHAFFLRPACA